MFQEQIDELHEKLKEYNPEKKRLKELDLFVLDNSLRETTVGQLRGHTLENKWKIYNEVKKVGFKNMIVESFNHMTRVGDKFIRQLLAQGEDMSDYYAFTEFIEETVDRVPQNDIPIGLLKMEELGINNVMMELDLVYYGIDYNQFDVKKICKLLSQRFQWIREHLSPDSQILVNIRDFSPCMLKNPQRLFHLVNFLSSLPDEERIFGIAYEEGGTNLPEQLAVWTSCVRKEMNRCGWKNGHLIVHVHEQFGMCDVVQMECLANGATGIWAGLCEEGAMMGHASSCLTIMNLIRLGNKKVLQKFNCTHLRSASRAVTEITTGHPPHPKQPVCGSRALDVVFGLEPLTSDKKEFNLPDFFGEEAGMRMSTLATPPMIVLKLQSVFGKHVDFTEQRAHRMREVMLEDLGANRKEEYQSAAGLALLFDRSGGKLNTAMAAAVEKMKLSCQHQQGLLDDVRKMWDEWDMRDGVIDDELEFTAFYNGFMAPYFGCYRCDETRRALQAIDIDSDGKVDWNEFAVYLKWAVNEYPETETAEQLLDITFRKGLIPAMQDEILKELPHRSYEEDNADKEFYKGYTFVDNANVTHNGAHRTYNVVQQICSN